MTTGPDIANGNPTFSSVADIWGDVLERAVRMQASDLFLLSEEDGVRIAVRRMGIVETLQTLSRELGRSAISHIKAEAGIDIGDRRRPHEGRLLQSVGDRLVDLRVNIIPTLYGEDVAARLLDRKFGLRSLDQIGLNRNELMRLQSAISSPSGLVLVTGPTGTGKTTTLYACVQYLNSGARKINTLEDPIEYAVPGVRQSQVSSRIGVDFAELLRNILRQSADVIMIGEIRDEETAKTAVRAANSGTLVLATVHATVAAHAVQSLSALGVNPYFLSNSLLAVVAQRLVRTLCHECRVGYDISESPGTFADIQSIMEPGLGSYIYGPGGCENCFHQGYNGRTGLFELMVINRRLKQLIAQGVPADDLQQAAVECGMVEFSRAAMLKVAQGVTSTEEIMGELPAEHLGIG